MQSERVVQKETITRSRLNQLCPGGVKGLYTALKFKGYYLPDYDSKCINAKYLIGLVNGSNYTVKCDKVKEMVVYKNVSATRIIDDLYELSSTGWGFTSEQPPNYEWLVKVIGVLKPAHEIFKPLPARADTNQVEIEKE